MVERYTPARKKHFSPFKKGRPRPPTAGRKPGTPNKVTKLIRDALDGSGARAGMLRPVYRYVDKTVRRGKRLVEVHVRTDEILRWEPTGEGGLEGYLLWLACNNPSAYAALLGKAMPLQIVARDEREESVASKFSEEKIKAMNLDQKMAAMHEMIGLTKALPKPSHENITEGEFTEVPREAAE